MYCGATNRVEKAMRRQESYPPKACRTVPQWRTTIMPFGMSIPAFRRTDTILSGRCPIGVSSSAHTVVSILAYRGFDPSIPCFRSLYTVFSILLYRVFYPCIPWFLHASPAAFAKGGYRHELSAAKSVPIRAAMAQKNAILYLSGHFRASRKQPPKTPAINPRKPSYETGKALI